MDPATRLPDHLVEDALAFESGERTPVEPKHASTVVLLRAGSGGAGSLEVYLLRRHVDMAFAAGMCVFPGGGVDPRDFDHAIGWAGPSPAEWAARMRRRRGAGPGAGVCGRARDVRGVRRTPGGCVRRRGRRGHHR